MLDAVLPRNVGHVHEAVDPLLDAHEDSEVRDVADAAPDDGALGILFLQSQPGVRRRLFEAQRDALALGIHLEDHDVQHLSDGEDLGGVADLPCPEHFRDMDEAFDARFELDEGAVVDDADHLAFEDGTDGILLGDPLPGVRGKLFEAQGDPLLFAVEGQHLHPDPVALAEVLRGLRNLAPGDVGDVEQPVDAAQVDEEAVVGDVLDDPLDDLPLFDRLEELLAVRLALLLHDGPPRQDDVVAVAVELEDVELHGLADEAVQVPDGPDVHLGAGQERRDPDVHRQAALDPLRDRPLDGLVVLELLPDDPPGLDPGGLVAREDQAVVLAPSFHEDLDLVSHADGDVPGRVA